jgi:hypothetical protein
MIKQVIAAVEAAEPASALWGFATAWRRATVDRDDEEGAGGAAADDEFEGALAGAIASDDVVVLGRLLMQRNVNSTHIRAKNLPATVLRRPTTSPILDVAFASGAVAVAQNLLEFHEATPTRDTLKMALSSGNFELIRICWGGLPDEQGKRVDLLEVASDFHQLEVLSWLFRDAGVFERELLVGSAIQRHQAGALLAVMVDGFQPWWAAGAAARWAPTSEIAFGPAPEGFWQDGGWCTTVDGRTKGIRIADGRWTRRETESLLGKACEVKDVVLPSGVTAIGLDAFDSYVALQSLMIQPGCRKIEDGSSSKRGEYVGGAMAGCSSLVEAKIPGTCRYVGAFAFRCCSGLRQLTVPCSVTDLGSGAFIDCSGMTELTILSGLSTIGHGACINCTGLTHLSIPSSVWGVGNGAFLGCSGMTRVTIPTSVTSIGSGAFNGCSRLTELTIPPSLNGIRADAFRDCLGLRQLSIPSSVTSIRNGAFMGCSGLKRLVIAQGVRIIGPRAFSGCSGLRALTIPSSVTSLGDEAFRGCSGLTELSIPSSIRTIRAEVFYGCSGLSELTIPSGIAHIKSSAFRGCSGLLELTIPSSVKRIGRGVFYGCSGLKQLTIPTGMASLAREAFFGCSGLRQLAIPKSVRNIGKAAFSGCSDLRRLTIPANITQLGGKDHDVFHGLTKVAYVELVDAPLSLQVVANVEPALAPGARIVGSDLAGRMFGRFAIATGC